LALYYIGACGERLVFKLNHFTVPIAISVLSKIDTHDRS